MKIKKTTKKRSLAQRKAAKAAREKKVVQQNERSKLRAAIDTLLNLFSR